jgi:hypothetical protein
MAASVSYFNWLKLTNSLYSLKKVLPVLRNGLAYKMPNVIKLLKAIIYERSLISYGVYSKKAPGVSFIIDNCSIQDSQVGHGQGS